MATANELVRKYLNSVGVKDDQIGYDNKRNQVTVGGTDFYQPVKVENGVSYGDTAGLNNAWNQYQQRTGQAKSNALMGQLSTALANPWTPEQFSYTPESDPAYQAALRTAQANAKQATGNAIASLNARGIDTSTVASDRAAQIEQQSLGNVTDNVLPQLMSQAYSRWANEQGMKQNAQQNWISGLASLLGVQQNQNQQLINNAANAEAASLNKKNSNLNAALAVGSATGKNILPQDDWSGLFRQAGSASTPYNLSGLQFQSSEDQRQFENTLRQALQDHQIRNDDAQLLLSFLSSGYSADANELQGENATYNRLFDIWDRTGVAPPGLEAYGIAPGTTQRPSSSSSSSQTSAYDSTVKNLDSMANYKKDFKGNNNLTNATDVEKAILQSGLTPYEMWQLYNRYGLKWDGEVPTRTAGTSGSSGN